MKTLSALLATCLLVAATPATFGAGGSTPEQTNALGTDPNELIGVWIAPISYGYVPEIIIARDGSQLTMQAFGSCHPIYCPWGIVPAIHTGNSLTATFVSSLGTTTITVELVDRDSLSFNAMDTSTKGSSVPFSYSMKRWSGEPKYGGGTGTPMDPYLLSTPEHLRAIGADPNDWDKHFKLMADIDLGAGHTQRFLSIGSWRGSKDKKPFTGRFDGNGHAISNLYRAVADGNCVGLFGYIEQTPTNWTEIRNLELIDPWIEAPNSTSVGALVGSLGFWVPVRDCHVRGARIRGRANVGGLAGDSLGLVLRGSTSGTVSGVQNVGGLVGCNKEIDDYYEAEGEEEDCTSSAAVEGIENVGGLVGQNEGYVLYCGAAGPVHGGQRVGGLVGDNPGAIDTCYATGKVSGTGPVGGLVGRNGGWVMQCYSAGQVDGNDVGGLIGAAADSDDVWVQDCLWDVEASGVPTSAGGVGKTTAQMLDPNTYRQAGWSVVAQTVGPHDLWALPPEGGYPKLWWHLSPRPALLFAQGTGTPDDPYLITTAAELNGIGSEYVFRDAYFKLGTDLDLAGVTLHQITSFRVFDGNDREIRNLTTATGGMFSVNHGSEVKNLWLVNCTADGGGYAFAGIIASSVGGRLTNCHVEGGHVARAEYAGGLVGDNWGTLTGCTFVGSIESFGTVGGLAGRSDGQIVDCEASGRVQGNGAAGGLVGSNGGGTIRCSRSTAEVAGGKRVGGIVGDQWAGAIAECCTYGSVTGSSSVGGLVGYKTAGTITNSYSRAAVSGELAVGGLAGFSGYAERRDYLRSPVTHCFFAGTLQGTAGVSGLVVVNEAALSGCFWDKTLAPSTTTILADLSSARTTSQMQRAATFTAAGWDFVGETKNGTADLWWIDEGNDYPRLWWEAEN